MASDHENSIAIIGGGISGLSAAIALARKGHRVLVAEKRIRGEEAGAGIQISPNASHILLRWGLGGALGQTAVAPTGLAIRRWGEPRAYAQMPMSTHPDGAPFWLVLRQDLHRTLLDSVRSNPLISYHEGWNLLRMQEDSKQEGRKQENSKQDKNTTIRLIFDTGSENKEIEAHCVLGADGQHSSVRRLLGDARDLDPSGFQAWRTLIPAEKTLDFIRAASTNLWLGKDAHAVHYPVARGQLINLVVIRKANIQNEGWGSLADRSGLDDIRATAAPTLRDLMDLAPQWNVWTLQDRHLSSFIAKGQKGLLGDAAHPVLPFLAQGAAMAIEDAAVLAHCLPKPGEVNPDTITKGLKRYAAMRSARVHKVYKAARSNAFAYHLSPALAWFRDRRMTSLGEAGMNKRYIWLYNWRAPD